GLLFLALAAPWFVAASYENPDFLWFFFIHEHLLRYATTEAHRVQPWWYFGALLWVGFLPWVGSGLAALLRPGFRLRGGGGAFNPGRIFLVYGVFVLVFFSLSDSKLAPYILPAYPAFALLAGQTLAKRGQCRADLIAAGILGVALVVVAFNLHWFVSSHLSLALLAGGRPWLLMAGGVLIAGAAIAWWADLKQWRVVVLAFAALLSFQCINWGCQSLSPIRSARNMAQVMAPLAE